MMTTLLNRHRRIALQVSGGKDSLACLYLSQPYWDRLTVFWGNTGAAFPETQQIMQQVRDMVPHFVEVTSDAIGDVEQHGWPVDVVPVVRTVWGRATQSHVLPLMRSRFDCCWTNLWQPMHEAMRQFQPTLIIRGQRNQETVKAPIRSGDIVDGIEYYFPLERWSAEDVIRYLGDRLPAHYRYTQTSLDCWHCTAYLFENSGKWQYMREHHSEKLAVVMTRLSDVRYAVQKETAILDAVYQAATSDVVMIYGDHHGE